MKKAAIIIFVKNPELGQVKKRVAKTLGDENALRIYEQMLDHTNSITRALSTEKFLFYNKKVDRNDIWENDIYQKDIQQGIDIATRVQNAFKKVFKLGFEHVLIIGSDCLELDERIIRLAFRQLEHFDSVLGPTKDGGFYLLGMNDLYPELFKLSGWGTPDLAAETQNSIQKIGKTCFMLSELAGINTVEDLNENLKLAIH